MKRSVNTAQHRQRTERQQWERCRKPLVNLCLPITEPAAVPSTAARQARSSQSGAHKPSQRCHTCHPPPCPPKGQQVTPRAPGQGQTLLLLFSCSDSEGSKGYREIWCCTSHHPGWSCEKDAENKAQHRDGKEGGKRRGAWNRLQDVVSSRKKQNHTKDK